MREGTGRIALPVVDGQTFGPDVPQGLTALMHGNGGNTGIRHEDDVRHRNIVGADPMPNEPGRRSSAS